MKTKNSDPLSSCIVSVIIDKTYMQRGVFVMMLCVISLLFCNSIIFLTGYLIADVVCYHDWIAIFPTIFAVASTYVYFLMLFQLCRAVEKELADRVEDAVEKL